VDAVLLHLKKKPQPDVPLHEAVLYRRFVETGIQNGLTQLMTPKQVSAALIAGGFSPDFTPAHLLYVQWLCLFRSRPGRNERP
jgi:23S rRNA (adenine-N6)-dimethyltransferase